jgi:hypothetical protein
MTSAERLKQWTGLSRGPLAASGALRCAARPRLSRLLPDDVTKFTGPKWTTAMLAAVNGVGTVRSLIHILAPDSGARSIASMDTKVAGGDNIVALLAQWGGGQLLEAGVIWVVLRRYRGLVPLMLGVQALRVGIGTSKPLVTARTPPGALSWGLLPAAAVALVASLTGRNELQA